MHRFTMVEMVKMYFQLFDQFSSFSCVDCLVRFQLANGDFLYSVLHFQISKLIYNLNVYKCWFCQFCSPFLLPSSPDSVPEIGFVDFIGSVICVISRSPDVSNVSFCGEWMNYMGWLTYVCVCAMSNNNEQYGPFIICCSQICVSN